MKRQPEKLTVQQQDALDIVIVSYRCKDLLRLCLESLQAHLPAQPTAIFVVDNASSDGTVEMLGREFPSVRLIAAKENLGFSRANNLAIRSGRAPYVLVLNPDTEVTAGALDHMIALMNQRPEVGISGCRLELPDGTFDHASRRGFPTPVSALGHFTGLGRRERAQGGLAAYRAPTIQRGPVDAVNGAFMFMRRGALEEVGLFDEGYWLYMEDLDLCYRFGRVGWVTWFEPEVSVVHRKGGSSGKHRTPRANYAFHYGMYRFYKKFYAQRSPWMVNATIYMGIAVKLAWSLAATPARTALSRRSRGQPPTSSAA